MDDLEPELLIWHQDKYVNACVLAIERGEINGGPHCQGLIVIDTRTADKKAACAECKRLLQAVLKDTAAAHGDISFKLFVQNRPLARVAYICGCAPTQSRLFLFPLAF